MPDPAPARPPALADALLGRALPEGAKGLTILGDLHEEFQELTRTRGLRAARFWYWRSALSLSARYVMRRAGGRDRRSVRGLVASSVSDLRIGVRMLSETPGLSAMTVVTMGLGIGAATHGFSLMKGTVLQQPPVEGADRLVVVADATTPDRLSPLSHQMYVDLLDVGLPLEAWGAFEERSVSVAADADPAQRLPAALMGPDAFEVFGVQPLVGRVFDDADFAAAARRVVISHMVWRTRFGSDPDVAGQVMRLDGTPTEIVGVMPEGFEFPAEAQLWLPLDLSPSPELRDRSFLTVFGRTPRGVAPQATLERIDDVATRLSEGDPDRYASIGLTVFPFVRLYVESSWLTVTVAAFVGSLGVLLIACANAANLLLVRSSVRYGEVAIRMALGASRLRVVRQLLTETLILGTAGAVLGVALTALGVPLVAKELAPATPYWIEPSVDGGVLLFAITAMLITSALAGLYPAVMTTRPSLEELLRDGSRGSSLRKSTVSRWLVVSEIAISCGLLIVAGLTLKSLTNLRSAELGFREEGVQVFRVAPSAEAVNRPAADSGSDMSAPGSPWAGRDLFYRELQRRLRALASVESVAVSGGLPALSPQRWSISVAGATYPRPEDRPFVNGIVVTDGFFETLGIPLVMGRDLDPREVWDPQAASAIVTESFVGRVLGARDPLGASFRIGPEDSPSRPARIVGVVPDTHAGSAASDLADARRDLAHVFVTPSTFAAHDAGESARAAEMWVVVRSSGAPNALFTEVRRVVAELDPDAPVFGASTLADSLRLARWSFNLVASVFTVVALLALFLAAVGLYGVVAYSVSQSRQELGIRVALGADASRIRRLVLGRTGLQLTVGLGLGLLVGYALALPISSAMSSVDPGDPAVYAVIVATLVVTGLLATILPARAAGRADPVQVMRD